MVSIPVIPGHDQDFVQYQLFLVGIQDITGHWLVSQTFLFSILFIPRQYLRYSWSVSQTFLFIIQLSPSQYPISQSFKVSIPVIATYVSR